jgi:hypothetical protein
MDYEINLPNQVSLHTIGSFLKSNEFFPNNPSQFHLSFNPSFTYLEPFALAMLAAWADHWSTKEIPISCKNLDSKGVDYAVRMGLFKYMNHKVPRDLVTHESAGQFIPLCKLENSSDVANFMAEMVPILQKHHPKYSEAVKYSLSELIRNVVEHAGGAAAYACAQFYRKSDKVSIGVADCGMGITESLSNVMTISNDSDALMQALRPGVSGASKTMYGSPDNAGAGLFYNKCIAHASNEYFGILSGKAAFRLRKKQITSDFKIDPSDDNHDIYDDIHPWKGTVAAINVNISSGNEFSNLMKKILSTYSTHFKPKKKVKINFT